MELTRRFLQILTFLTTFVLAMILFPEAQARAQAEIDNIIGNGRLPNFEDRDSLPYIEALLREVLRWHGPAPLGKFTCQLWVLDLGVSHIGVPHACVDEDVYNGFYIPKGAHSLSPRGLF